MRKQNMYTNKKMVVAGNIVSLYEFENVIKYGHKKVEKNKQEKEIIKKPKENTLDSRIRSMKRARQKVINLVSSNCNMWKHAHDKECLPIMYTLTFKDDVRDIKVANNEFTKFIQRANYYFTREKSSFLKYVNVIEFQDLHREGVVHYHCLFFNLPWIRFKDFEKLWGNGFVQYEKVNNVIGAAKYISKYMAKSFDDKRLCGEKCYFISRGLKQPFVIRNPEDILVIRELLPYPFYEKTYDSEYQGQTDFSEYYLKQGDYSREDIMKVLALRGYTDVEL